MKKIISVKETYDFSQIKVPLEILDMILGYTRRYDIYKEYKDYIYFSKSSKILMTNSRMSLRNIILAKFDPKDKYDCKVLMLKYFLYFKCQYDTLYYIWALEMTICHNELEYFKILYQYFLDASKKQFDIKQICKWCGQYGNLTVLQYLYSINNNKDIYKEAAYTSKDLQIIKFLCEQTSILDITDIQTLMTNAFNNDNSYIYNYLTRAYPEIEPDISFGQVYGNLEFHAL